MSADLELLLKHLREHTGRVELDLPPPMTSGSIEVAARHARERRNAIARGERAAYLYVGSASSKSVSMKVNEDEASQLVAAGATWEGDELHAPKPLSREPTRMIHGLRLQDFKAHRETELELSRLTVLVGDNASGKTSVLDALAINGTLQPSRGNIFRAGWSIPNLIRRGSGADRLAIEANGIGSSVPWTSRLAIASDPGPKFNIEALVTHAGRERDATATGDPSGFGYSVGWDEVRSVIGEAASYRLRAESIASAAYSTERDPRIGADGTNTAVVLAAMKLGDDERFEVIEVAMRRLVPSLLRIRIRPENLEVDGSVLQGSKIYFDFQGAKDVPADAASQGTLILLALLTSLYRPGRPSLVLIDDIEQGLHPRAQRELVQLLQNLLTRPEFCDLQIIASTHSPYVLDLLDPAAVYAFALRDDGTSASKRLSAHPDAEKMKGSLTAGQLWSLDEERTWVLE